jgi:hypothetical protein
VLLTWCISKVEQVGMGTIVKITILFAACILSGASRANIVVTANIGHGDSFRLAHWTPITLQVINTGASIDADIEIITTAGNILESRQNSTRYIRQLELPGGTSKRVYFTVHLENIAHPLQIRVLSQQRVVTRTTLNLKRNFTDAKLIAVVSPNVSLDYLTNESTKVVYPKLEHLPERWFGYDGVVALILHGTTIEKLRNLQYEALLRWLAQGGQLIVSGRADYAALRSRRMRDLLPAQPLGLQTLSDDTLSRRKVPREDQASTPQQHASSPGTNDVYVHKVTPGGRILAKVSQWPLAIAAERGDGQVVYLTFDLGVEQFSSAAVVMDLWDELLAPPLNDQYTMGDNEELNAPLKQSAGTTKQDHSQPLQPVITARHDRSFSPERSRADAVLAAQPVNFPDFAVTLFICAAYLALLAIGQTLRPNANRLLIYGTTWLAACFTAPLAYGLFASQFPSGPTAINTATIAPITGSPYARANFDLALFSTHNQALEFSTSGARPAWRPLLPNNDSYRSADWSLNLDARGYVKIHDQTSYVTHSLEGDDVIRFDITASLEVPTDSANGTDIHLHIRNNHSSAIEAAWLRFNGELFALSRIPPNSSARVKLPRTLAEANANFSAPAWRRRIAKTTTLPSTHQAALAALATRSMEFHARTNKLPAAQILGFTNNPLSIGDSATIARGFSYGFVHLGVPVHYARSSLIDETDPVQQPDNSDVQ